MDRQTGLILAAISILLCACPGLFSCVFGGLIIASPAIDPTMDVSASWWLGALMMVCGLGLSLIPVGIGAFFLSRKAAPGYTPQELDEKLPPAI